MGLTNPDEIAFTDAGLIPSTTYYYLIRAVNDDGGSSATTEVSALTDSDTEAPSIPGNLTVTAVGPTNVSLQWGASTDNVGVFEYDIFDGPSLLLSTPNTEIDVTGLASDQVFNFKVQARDISGNTSPLSNQATAATVVNGLTYGYYEGNFTALPDFNDPETVPIHIGQLNNFDISPRDQNFNFAFKYDGYVFLPSAGNYTFYTTSDDGSKLYIGGFDEANLVVNNDGLHGPKEKSGVVNLAAGAHPITVTFFERFGGQMLEVRYEGPGISKQLIPDNALVSSSFVPPPPPAAPSALTATTQSYEEINLTWVDNSNNENGFEIFRSSSSGGPYDFVGAVGQDVVNFTDTGLAPVTTYYYIVLAAGDDGESQGSNEASDTTDPLPPPPAAPGNLVVATISSSQLDLSWDDNSNDEDGFEVWRQIPNDAFKLLLTTASNVTAMSDTQLLGHTEYKYQVRAFNVGGPSNFTPEGSATTANNDPALDPIADEAMHHTTVLNIPVSSTDLDGDPIQLVVNNLPAFGSFVDNLDGTGTITFDPAEADQGSYPGIEVVATDNFSGSNSVQFNLTVDDNFKPVIAAVSDQMVQESDTLEVDVTVTDANNAGISNIKVVVMGSSTALGTGASIPGNSWAGLLDTHITTSFPNSSLVNIAKDGISSFSLLSTGDPDANIDKALAENPTIIIVNMPSNDVNNNIPEATTIANYTTIRDLAAAQGVDMFFTTTQPRNFSDFSKRQLLQIQAQTIRDTFSPFVIDIYDELADSDLRLKPVYAADANSHLNDLGHLYLYETALPVIETTLLNNHFTFTLDTAPSFTELQYKGGGVATLTFTPGFSDEGIHPIQVSVSDNAGGTDNVTFNLDVIDKPLNLNPIYVNFNKGWINVPAPWYNSFSSVPSQGLSMLDMSDEMNQTTDVDITLEGNWVKQHGSGMSSTTGAVPMPVMRTGYWHNTAQEDLKLSGLDAALRYDLTFFASYNDAISRLTDYTVGTETVSLEAAFNTDNTVTIFGIIPNSSGEIIIEVKKGAGSPGGFINGMIIQPTVDDGNPPDAPDNLVATVISDTRIDLSWNDNSGTETGFEIQRSLTMGGPYGTIASEAANTTGYSDTGLDPSTTYYYVVKATNHNGDSFSNEASGTTQAPPPPPADPSGLSATSISHGQIDLSWTDNSNNETGFEVHRSTTSSGPYSLIHTTAADASGYSDTNGLLPNTTYYYVVRAINSSGTSNFTAEASATTQTAPLNLNAIFVNFNKGWINVPAPYNSFNTAPVQGLTLTDLLDDTGTATLVDITLETNWFKQHGSGMSADGFAPLAVTRTAYWHNTAQEDLKLSGLDITLRYDLTFFASYDDPASRLTEYTVGGETVSLEPAFNVNNTVTIFGAIPNASGELIIEVKKGSGSLGGYINAMVIQPTVDDGTPPDAPTNLTATAISESQIDLSWTDNSNSENGFEIHRSLTMGGPYTQVDAVSSGSVSYSDTGLNPETTYYYQVIAFNGNGSNASNEGSATTLAPPPPPADPSNPAAVAISHSQIDLSWTDNSNNETGFEIHRSTTMGGPYSLIHTTGSNAVSHSDLDGLLPNTTYYYVIRAMNSTIPSNFTAEVSATTQSEQLNLNAIYVNFNKGWINVPAPYNSFSSVPSQGLTLTDLLDDTGTATLVDITLETNWVKQHGSGMSADGFAPLPVTRTAYWHNQAREDLKLSGLSTSLSYDLTFFASYDDAATRLTEYTVGAETVSLEPAFNVNNTVTIFGAVPNASGEIIIEVKKGSGSLGGYINALVIQPNPPAPPAARIRTDLAPETDNSISEITVYPNPFHGNIHLGLSEGIEGKFNIKLTDMSGKILLQRTFLVDRFHQSIELTGGNFFIPSGQYFLEVISPENQIHKIFKILSE